MTEPRIWEIVRDTDVVAKYLRRVGWRSAKQLREDSDSPVCGIGSTLGFILQDPVFKWKIIDPRWRRRAYSVEGRRWWRFGR